VPFYAERKVGSALDCGLLGAFAALVLAGCGSRNTYIPPPPAKVVVAQPVQEPVTLYLDLTGNTAAFRTVNLVARVQDADRNGGRRKRRFKVPC
jgi:hypothetical protein